MIRRFCVQFFRRSVIAILLFCLGCAAQAPEPELNQRIEHRVRASFNVPPAVQIEVGARKPSGEFPNYDSVSVTFSHGGRKEAHEFLLSKDGKTLLRLTKMDLSQDPYAEVMGKIDLQGRPVRGAAGAKVTVVNYDDFQCPFCARMHQTLVNDVLKAYGDKVRIIYKDYPLAAIHPWATHAAVDANCLAAESGDAYWEYADYVHFNQKEITGAQRPLAEQKAALDRAALEVAQRRSLPVSELQGCMQAQSAAAVQASVREGDGLGVSATPTLFVNGQKLEGAVPREQLFAVLDQALREAGETPPARPTEAAGAKPSN
jgi:protein-disulfide isomerase